MIRIKDIIHSLEEWAPTAIAESYDNVGLLVGNQDVEITSVLISLDCTEDVVKEAIAKGCNLVISHHPILFKGLKRFNGSNYVERTVAMAIKNDIALYAIHTNLDNVSDGVNKKICDLIGLKDTEILSPKGQNLEKLVFFVPVEQANEVRNAIFEIGAGQIGNYTGCSFNISGEGTYTAREGANPTLGKVGTPHHEEEMRIEIMIPVFLRDKVLDTLKKVHPYEEVAYFIQPIENKNQYVGSGMIGYLPEEIGPMEFIKLLKEEMKLEVIKCTSLGSETIRKVAVCGGSGSFLLQAAKRQKADIFITGDFKYHEFFDAENEIVIADIGHYESERFTIDLIAEKIRKKFSTFATHLTEVNTNPIHYI